MNVLVMTGTSGVAREIARVHARRGDKVSIGARDLDEGQRIAADLQTRYGVQTRVVAYDAEREELSDELAEMLRSVDRVYLTIGYLGSEAAARSDPREAERVEQLNHTGLLPLIAAAIESPRGELVVLSSVAGDRPRASNYTYGVAKRNLNRSLDEARASSKGRRVITIKLGPVDTSMTYGRPVAKTITADAAARGIVNAANGDSDVVYIPALWRIVMGVIRMLPGPLFRMIKA